jgi:hypothetical protein
MLKIFWRVDAAIILRGKGSYKLFITNRIQDFFCSLDALSILQGDTANIRGILYNTTPNIFIDLENVLLHLMV